MIEIQMSDVSTRHWIWLVQISGPSSIWRGIGILFSLPKEPPKDNEYAVRPANCQSLGTYRAYSPRFAFMSTYAKAKIEAAIETQATSTNRACPSKSASMAPMAATSRVTAATIKAVQTSMRLISLRHDYANDPFLVYRRRTWRRMAELPKQRDLL